MTQATYANNPYTVQISYTFVLNFTDPQTFQGQLYLGATKSLFRYSLHPENSESEAVKMDESSGNYSFRVLDSTNYFIYSDREGDRVLQLEQIPGTADLCVVSEHFPLIEWAYTGREKKIEDYPCFEAIGQFRGREYTVWYTDDIPASYGPWKFHGLPGLVLEAVDATGEVQFYARSVQPLMRTNQPDNPMDNGSFEVMDRKSYLDQLRQYINRMEQRMVTRVGRGFQVKVKSASIQTIEMYDY